ncbi:MAG: PilZ domain-containing protein [Nitrospirota bacterium]
MKKVLIAKELHALLEQDRSFLDRTDMQVFVAATNDEVLTIHRAERVDLIIAKLDLPGMASEKLYGLIREDAALRTVSTILCCANTPAAIKQCSHCRVNAVLLEPLHSVLLMAKAQQLLDIAAREMIRVLLGVVIDGRFGDEAFYCRTKNVSATGMMIETRKRLVEGARLTCQFYLPDATRIQAPGKIVRIIQQTSGGGDQQYGLMFTDIAPETKQLLADFVESTRRKSQPGGQ